MFLVACFVPAFVLGFCAYLLWDAFRPRLITIEELRARLDERES
jgi:hypothetical protein